MLSSAASFLMTSVPNAISSVSSRYAAGSPSASSGPTFDRDLDRLYHVKIRPLLDAVDMLRGVLREESSIQLPTIVVVGDQSSGKSSVLEALSGVALPRGREITTRCPLVLRLINTAVDKNGQAIPNAADEAKKAKKKQLQQRQQQDGQRQGSGSHAQNGHANGVDNNDGADNAVGGSLDSGVHASSSSDPAPYAVISIISPNIADGEVIHNLADIGAKIEQATAKLAGRGIGVVSTPIYLSVFRAHSPDLTLVDLPGITRNPIGDQPKDIYKQIKDMIYQFITPETAVILNVMPATVDFPTCEGVMMSKEVDQAAIRTIGVVTKLDLAEKGIKRKLETGVEQLNLRLGVVAVRNRNQDENDRGISFEVSRTMEQMFFKNHPELASLAVDFAERRNQQLNEEGGSGNGGLYLGTNNLAQLLTVIQEQRIRTTLPKIKLKCRDMLNEYRAKYRELPTGHVSTGGEARVKIEHLLNSSMQQVAALVRGEHAVAKGDVRLHISPRLAELYGQLQKELNTSVSNFFGAEYAAQVEEEVREQAGICLPNFQSAQVFRGLMHREIFKLKAPATALLEASRAAVQHVLQTVCRSVFHVYPHLLQRVLNQTQQFLDTRCAIIMDRLEEFLMQEEEIFTNNSYYLDTSHKIKHAINERLYAIQQTQQQSGGKGGAINVPATITIPVNDLTVTVNLAELIRHAEKSHHNNKLGAPGSASAAAPSPSAGSSVFGIQTLLNASGASILEMQINAYAYTQIMHKRICDSLPLFLRFHLLRSLTQSPATATALASINPLLSPTHMSLSSLLQKEFIDMTDKALVECMKEEAGIASKREQLNKSIERMEKAMNVFDSL